MNIYIEEPTLRKDSENGVCLALTLYEWCAERIIQFQDSDTSKRVLDAIAKARNKPIPMFSLNDADPSCDPYELQLAVCSKFAMVAGDMIRLELTDLCDVDRSITDFLCWDQFRVKIHPRIVGCLNSMLYGYCVPQPTENDKQ
jgi:hypothetical protein